MTNTVTRLTEFFASQFGAQQPAVRALGPGRVNLIGDHTDYNEGFVLPMTVDSGVYWAMSPETSRQFRFYSVNFDEWLEFGLDDIPATKPGHWSCYVVGVIAELADAGLIDGGASGVVIGDLTLGAGLSSSAALCVSTSMALQKLFEFELDAVAMIKLCQRVEHQYARVMCGIMDQFVSRLGEHGHALLLDCQNLHHEQVPIDFEQLRIVIVVSGVKRSLTESRYNERRQQCDEAVAFFAGHQADIKSLRDVGRELFEAEASALDPLIARRAKHVLDENQAVLDMVTALRRGDLSAAGEIMFESHQSLRHQFETSVAEMDSLVDIASSCDGVYGARMTGGGFGGCTVNLMQVGAESDFAEKIQAEYQQRHGLQATIQVLTGNLQAHCF